MIQSALVAKLKNVTSNVYAMTAPQSVGLPVVTVDYEGSDREYHWSGGSIATGFINSDFEINVWAKTNSDAFSLGQQIIAEIENFSGPLYGTDSPRTKYGVAWIEITSDLSGFDGETKTYQYSIFITVKHAIEA